MLGWMMFINLYAQIDLDQSIEIPIEIDLLHNLPHKYAPTTTIFINLIQANELEELNFLSPIQCANIIQHRTIYGPFLHAQELIQCNLNIEQIDSLFPNLDFSTSMMDEWRSIQSHFLVLKSKMYSHNIIMDILLATGIFGFVLLLPVFLKAFSIFWKDRFSSPITLIFLYLFIMSFFSGSIYSSSELFLCFLLLMNTNNNFQINNRQLVIEYYVLLIYIVNI